MKNTYRDEAEVLVWTNGPGHLALELRSDRKAVADRKFISWWPGATTQNPLRRVPSAPHPNRYQANRAELGERSRELLEAMTEEAIAFRLANQPRPGQKQMNKGGFNGEYGLSAHERFKMPLVGTRTKDLAVAHHFGLFGRGIGAWWAARKASHEGYRFISATINCSGTVAEALDAGGATAFNRKPGGFVVTPTAVRNWTEEINASLSALNAKFRQCLDRLNASTVPAVVQARNNVANELLDPGIYLNRAGEPDNPFQRAIDGALRKYHQTPWGAEITGEVFTAKIEQLATIVENIHAGVGEYQLASTSPRYATMLVLCGQIAAKLDAVGDPPYVQLA